MKNSPETKTLYDEAHLVAAAIRVLQHRMGSPPLAENISELIGFSLEQTHYLCNELAKQGVLEMVESAYGARMFIRDHTRIEEIPKTVRSGGIDEDIRKFQTERQAFSQKIESIKAQQAEKKKSLFAEMELKLKREIEKKGTGQE